MALNPEIALGVRPPVLQPLEIQSPLERYGKVLSLRAMMEQQQLRGLQLQGAQQEIEQSRRAAENEANFRALYADPTAKPTRSQVYGTLGPKGAAVVKTQAEIEEQDLKTRATKAARLGSIAGSMLDAATLNRGVMQAASEGLIDLDTARQLTAGGWNPEVAAQVKQFQQQALTAAQQFEQELKDAEEKRKAALAGPQLAEAKAKSLAEQLGVAAQTAPNSQAEWDTWRAGLSPELQQRIPAMFSPVAREMVRMLGVKPTAPVAGRDVPLPEAVQKQKVEEAAARANILQTPEKIAQDLEIKKRELEVQNQTNINKAMSGDAAKVYSIASNIQPGLEQLRQAFKKDYKGTLRGIVLGTNPELVKLASNVSDQVGRLRSGGAVNPSEEKRFKDQIASTSDLVVGNLDATLAALDRYISEAKSVADGLKPPGGAPKTPGPPPAAKKVKVWNEKTRSFEER